MHGILIGVALALTPLLLLAAMVFVLRQQMQIGLFAWVMVAFAWLAFLHLFSTHFMPWHWIGEAYSYAFTVLAIVLAVFCFRSQSQSAWFSSVSLWTVTALALTFTGVLLAHLWLGAAGDAQIDLKNPLIGSRYYVVQGGENRLTNHHHSDPVQRYAADLVVIDHSGRRAKGLLPHELNDYFAFNHPLAAPCDGVVRAVSNNHDDQKIGQSDTKNPAGNHVFIGCGRYSVLLAHLRREPNPLVKVGDVIKAGQWVGYIGNSGNTSEPHLHIHVVTDATEGDPSFPLSGVGVLFTINNKKMTRGKSD